MANLRYDFYRFRLSTFKTSFDKIIWKLKLNLTPKIVFLFFKIRIFIELGRMGIFCDFLVKLLYALINVI